MGSNAPVFRRAVLIALVRVVNAIFFLTTSSYCLLMYSSFAYQQFIKPHLVSWLTGFVGWHHLAFWVMLLLTAWTLLPELRHGRWRGIAWSYLAISSVIGMVLLVRPVLPQVENNGRGLALALVALLPPIWLAIFDHRNPVTLTPSSEHRVLKSAFIAAVLVWACQVAVIPWRWKQTGDITLGTGDVLFGMVTSLAGHVLVFAICAGAASVLIRAARKTGAARLEYWLIVLASAAGIMLVTNRIVFAGIAFTGPAAWTLSILFGVLVAAVWSGVVHILQSDRPVKAESAIERWLSPLPLHQTRPIFLLQKLFVLIVWFMAFGYAWFVVRPTSEPFGFRRAAARVLVPLACFAGAVGTGRVMASANQAFVPEFVLEGYVAVDPSYRLVHDVLTFPSAEQGRFYAHLRANSLIQHISVDPFRIDFDTSLAPSRDEKPHIFLFARIPLIVRVPERFRERFVADDRALALSTDITPTLYAFLGYSPSDLGPLYGRSLFVPREHDPSRRSEPMLIASSYGGVYAVLHDNGSRMYIVDGVNGRDYAYDLAGELPVRIGVTPASRAADQQFIRTQVDDIARAYHFVAER